MKPPPDNAHQQNGKRPEGKTQDVRNDGACLQGSELCPPNPCCRPNPLSLRTEVCLKVRSSVGCLSYDAVIGRGS